MPAFHARGRKGLKVYGRYPGSLPATTQSQSCRNVTQSCQAPASSVCSFHPAAITVACLADMAVELAVGDSAVGGTLAVLRVLRIFRLLRLLRLSRKWGNLRVRRDGACADSKAHCIMSPLLPAPDCNACTGAVTAGMQYSCKLCHTCLRQPALVRRRYCYTQHPVSPGPPFRPAVTVAVPRSACW